MKNFDLKCPAKVSFALVLLLTSCGGGEKFGEEAPFEVRPKEVRYDVSALDRDPSPRFKLKNPVAILLNNTHGLAACTSSLLANGFVLTNGHCILGAAGKPTSPRYLHVFFKNRSDLEVTYYKVKRIVDYKYVDFSFESKKSYPISSSEAEGGFKAFTLNYFKNREDWAILEIEDSAQALNLFSSVSPINQATFDYSQFFSDTINKGSILTYYAIDPNQGLMNGHLIGNFSLKIVSTTIDRRVPREYRKTLLGQIHDLFTATVKTFQLFKALPLADSYSQHGNSGSIILYNDKAIALLFGEGTIKVCTDVSCSAQTLVQSFLGMGSRFMSLIR